MQDTRRELSIKAQLLLWDIPMPPHAFEEDRQENVAILPAKWEYNVCLSARKLLKFRTDFQHNYKSWNFATEESSNLQTGQTHSVVLLVNHPSVPLPNPSEHCASQANALLHASTRHQLWCSGFGATDGETPNLIEADFWRTRTILYGHFSLTHQTHVLHTFLVVLKISPQF